MREFISNPPSPKDTRTIAMDADAVYPAVPDDFPGKFLPGTQIADSTGSHERRGVGSIQRVHANGVDMLIHTGGGLESSPIVTSSTLYIVAPVPDFVCAENRDPAGPLNGLTSPHRVRRRKGPTLG